MFEQSIEALLLLNEKGFGTGEHTLMLVYNPAGFLSMLGIKIGGTACTTPPYKTRRFFYLTNIMAFQNQLSIIFVKKVVEDLTASLVGMNSAVAFILVRSFDMELFASSRSPSSITYVECR